MTLLVDRTGEGEKSCRLLREEFTYSKKRYTSATSEIVVDPSSADGVGAAGGRGEGGGGREAGGGGDSAEVLAPWKSRASKRAAGEEDSDLESVLTQLEARALRLTLSLSDAEEEFQRCIHVRDAAKTEWARASSAATCAESRDERRLTIAKKELDSLRHLEAQQESLFQLEREKTRQRLRTLKMQARQAERQRTIPVATDDFVSEELSSGSLAVVTGGRPKDEIAKRRGRESHDSIARGDEVSFPPERGGGVGSNARGRAYDKDDPVHFSRTSDEETLSELQQRHDTLLASSVALHDREQALRKSSRLTDKDIEHWENRAELRNELNRIEDEKASIRAELAAEDVEAQVHRREALRHRGAQDRSLAEFALREEQFQEELVTESSALRAMELFLSSPSGFGSCGPHERQARLAEWLEADISLRQVEHMKVRLAEIVADAGARSHVLEQTVEELHADLDKRVAIILELVQRQRDNAAGRADRRRRERKRKEVMKAAGHPLNNSAVVTNADVDLEQSQAEAEDMSSLEEKVLEEELQHQRELFELRGEQVQGLEKRLAAFVAREAPKVHALRAWILVHEPLSCKSLEACAAAAGADAALVENVQAIRRDKLEHFEEAEMGWSSERERFAEASACHKRGCAEAATEAANLTRRKESLLRNLDRLLKLEAPLVGRVANANQAVERDQRRLVDLTARQLRVALSAPTRCDANWSDRILGALPLHALRTESARQTLADARQAVEETRSRQIQALLSIQEEACTVETELRRLREALETCKAATGGEAGLPWGSQPRQNCSHVEEQFLPLTLDTDASFVGGLASPASGPLPDTRQFEQSEGGSRLQVASTGQIERPRSRLEHDLEKVTFQLRELESGHAQAKMCLLESCQRIECQMKEEVSSISELKARHKSESTAVLKRYRTAHADMLVAEQRCKDIRARRDGVKSEVAEARSTLQAAQVRRQHRAELERRCEHFCGDDAMHSGSALSAHSRLETARSNEASSVEGKKATTAQMDENPDRARILQLEPAALNKESRKGTTPPAKSNPDRSQKLRADALPDLSEVQSWSQVHPDLCRFYEQIFPLLQGCVLGVYRKRTEQFVGRQLVLRTDLKRLEVWPEPHMATTRRVAEGSLRVDTILRVHVPKSTLVALRRCMLEEGLNLAILEEAAEVKSSEDHAFSSAMPLSEGSDDWDGAPRREPEDAVLDIQPCGVPPVLLAFDLVPTSGETWRLAALDVHKFYTVTVAINALLSSRKNLAAFALALGLGGCVASKACRSIESSR